MTHLRRTNRLTTGYFTYDLICVLARYELEGAGFLVHALCCLFVYGYAVFFGTLHWFGAHTLRVCGWLEAGGEAAYVP